MEKVTGADFKSATADDNKKLFIETYGCQMNVADSEVIASVMQMAEMMAMAQAGSTAGDPGASGPANPVDLMKAMMSGEDMEMFQNYMELFDEELSASGTPAKKGDSSHE